LKDAKADVNAWHRKSERSGLLFGNSGKKIPQHSLFGQSYGDLDAAKARRNEAGDDIGTLKNEKERLNAEFNRLDVKIQDIRCRQRERRELMTQGYTYNSVEVENTQLSKKFSQLVLRSKAAKRRSDRVLKQELEQNSVPQDRQRATDMKEKRKAALVSFMADDQVLRRRESFRNDWERSRENVV
jgi:predicted  nucleic acid-binding Zn-ribbon protein